MWPMVLLSTLISVVSMIMLHHEAEIRDLKILTQDQASILSFTAYRKSVIDYSVDHPGFIGEVSETDLSPYFPYGYASPGIWRNVVTPERVYVYTNYRLNAEMLNERFYRSLLVGKNRGGELVSLSGHNTSIVLPSNIPTNAIVIAGS